MIKMFNISHLSDQSKQRFACGACNLTYAQPQGLRKHIYTSQHGPTPLRDFVCKEGGCLAKFSLLSRLKRHKQTHLMNKIKFKCDLCDNQYSTKDGLRTHRMRVHR